MRLRRRQLATWVVLSMLFAAWQFHTLLSVPSRPRWSLMPAPRDVHITALELHHTNHALHIRDVAAPKNASSATPRRHRSLETAVLQTVESILFEDDALWETQRLVDDGHPSTHLALVCDMQVSSLSKRCESYFGQSSRRKRLFSVVPMSPPAAGVRGSMGASTEGSVPPHPSSRSDWILTSGDIMARLPEHAASMKQLSVKRLHALHAKPIPLDRLNALLTADKTSQNALAKDVKPVLSTAAPPGCLAVAEPAVALAQSKRVPTLLPSVRLLSARGINAAQLSPLQLWTVLHSASVVMFALNDIDSEQRVDHAPDAQSSKLLEALSLQFETSAVSENCSFAAAHDVEDAIDRPIVAIVRCRDVALVAPVCRDANQSGVVHGNSGPPLGVAQNKSSELPFICGSRGGARLTLSSALKWGTKTAIFRGHFSNRDVAVKMFHVDQYGTFRGFLAAMTNMVRSPYINYPTSSCFDPPTEAVYQLQPFLSNGRNLLQFMKREGKTLPWKHRLELAMQLLCVFEHLHAHPVGLLSFDDNHPEQYYVRDVVDAHGQRERLTLTMVDIDTLQLAVHKDDDGDEGRPQNSPVRDDHRNPADYKIQCRCFYCHGRSDCLYINSRKGYAACGQGRDDPSQGDKEDLSRIRPGRLCDGTNDLWFIAQSLYLIGKGSVAWGQVPHSEVVARLEAGRVPRLASSEPIFNSVVNDLFYANTTIANALQRLDGLCGVHRCYREGHGSGTQGECRVDTRAAAAYHSPLLPGDGNSVFVW